ncbi:MAG: serine hydrolase [Acidobacteriota bacterium]
MKRRRDAILSTLLLLTMLALGGKAATPLESTSSALAEDIQAYERFVSEQMAHDRIPGMSIGFIKGDFTWSRGFGFSDLENSTPAKPESSYRLASVSKTLTAIAVLQLVEEGKIDLDAEIQTYVPDFPRKKWPVTCRQLLGHVGGISHYKNYALEGHIKEPKDTRQALAIFQDFDLVAEPGTRYVYSSYGYNLLGAVIEGASQLPYGEFIKKNILDPLGMNDTRLDDPLDLIPNRARGYQLDHGVLKNSEYVNVSSRFAAGGIRSTVVDLLKYARGVMDRRLLRETTWRLMFSSMAVRSGLMTWYGMGWGVQPWGGHFAVGHSGAQPETRTYLLIFPAEEFAVAIACNLEGANLLPYARRLVELILDEDIDSTAYTPGKERQSIFQAVYHTFAFGLSAYNWTGAPLSRSRQDLKDSFDYFNGSVNEGALLKDYEETKKKIMGGIHLGSNLAFIKVGSYMAQALEEEGGREKLLGYLKRGPIAFFNDYVRLSTGASAPKRHPRFKNEFTRLMTEWEKDWAKTYTDEVRTLAITPGTEFDRVIPRLREIFSGASFYPDFSADLAAAAQHFYERNDAGKAALILNLGQGVYAGSPSLAASLGFLHFWQGDIENGRRLYEQARGLDSLHPLLRADPFLSSIGLLLRSGKRIEARALGRIALEFNPKEPAVYTALSDLSLAAGQKEEAVELLKTALKIDPGFEEARNKLKALEK